jgi:PAS domain S-box-containing protein
MATLMVAESLGAWRLVQWVPALKPIELVVEVVLDIAVVMPVLIFLFVLPTVRNIRQREASERALRAAHEELEVRVRERTAELDESNRSLREEAEGRRRARKAVEFQARLLDAVEQAVAATDGEGRVVYWNRFAEDLYGWKAPEVSGRDLMDVVTFIPRDGQRLDLLGQCGQGLSWTGEVEAVRRDDSRFPAYLACSCLPGDDGYVCLSFDITALQAAEEALRDSEEKYSNLVENSPTGIFIFQNGQFVFVNPRFGELLEYSRDELLRIDPWPVLHPDDRDRVREVARTRTEGKPVPSEYECRLVTKTGQVRWVAMQNTLIRFRGGVATLGNVQDVTERKRMETELHQLSARLLTVQEAERRRLARDLHDSLGQKLTGIKFLVEAALGKPWPDERRSGIGRLRALAPTIQDAVEEVRRIATELRPAILDDLGLLATIGWHLREFGKTHPSIAVTQQLAAAESDVPHGLRVPIFRILQEATNNVAKHSRAAHLVVGLGTAGGRLWLWVQDDGVGFDAGSPPPADGKGGFGLSSMRERAELSGGAFSVSSTPGGGTTVRAEWRLDSPVSV